MILTSMKQQATNGIQKPTTRSNSDLEFYNLLTDTLTLNR